MADAGYPGHPQVDDTPVRVGSILFTIVEPHKGHEVDYNRWYETDHLYAGCTVGPFNFAARRWVATAPLKKLRHVGSGEINDDPMVGSYLATYWVQEGHRDDWNKWAFQEFRWLHENGRMFPHRDHVHTSMYRLRAELAARPDGVPAELALDHRFPNIAAVIGETAPGVGLDRVDDWFRSRALPAEIMVELTPVPLLGDAPPDVPRDSTENRFLQLYFLEEPVLDAWDDTFARLGDDLDAAGLGRVAFASPFLATSPGTDAYTDQLW